MKADRLPSIVPICTNLRFDGTNEKLTVDIGELRKQNLSGEIVFFSNDSEIYKLKFNKLFELPLCFSIPYKQKYDNEIISVELTLGNKTVTDKLVLTEETIRKPMTWDEWLSHGK